ncbi:alpha/beta hydrolase family protein [Microbacterium paludicola]|uniref:alpha/beta fold hydrolase n=1 Tax=Microbacterium paludicola TaxID=300019 RepID=UPI0031D85C0E
MLLNVVEAGSGPRCAVLLHGMLGSAESWQRVVPQLLHAGYRVLAVDLPGHGLSPRDPTMTLEGAADAVVDTVRAFVDHPPAVAIGHSYGALLLAAAAERMRPRLAVYVDAPLAFPGGADRDATLARYKRDKRVRTPQRLRETRSHYSEADAVVEGRAAERFDPATSASISAGPGGSWAPSPGSIVLRAEPSEFVTDADARVLRDHGVDVRSIPGAAHTVWYSHFDAFVAALPEIFSPDVGGPS